MSKKKLSIERAFGDPSLNGPTPLRLKFSPDGKRITYLRPKDENDEILDLWVYEIAADRHRPLVRTEELVPPDEIALTEQEAARRERMRIRQGGIVDYQWAESGDRLLFPLSGALYVYDLGSGSEQRVRCVIDAAQGAVFTPEFSKSGTAIAFVRDGNLFVVDVETAAVRQLTTDGGGAVQNGVAEFVAQEEMGRLSGYWWSPDGKRTAYTQIDETAVPLVQRPAYYADHVEVIEQRYPAAGQANAAVRVGVVDVETAQTTWLQIGEGAGGTIGDAYIARVNWLPDGKQVAVQVQPRDQKALDLLFVDVASGQARQVLRETDDCWVNLHDDLRFLESGRFLWAAERDGFKHLYLYDLDGTPVRQLTAGAWPVSKVAGVDEQGGFVYFTGWIESPLETHLYRVSLEGGTPQRISREAGSHQVEMAADCAHWIDTWSRVGQAPRVQLCAADGAPVTVLEANEMPERDEYAWAESEFLTLQAEDGTTLHCALTRPLDFDPGRTYPVVFNFYGGPHGQVVRDAWNSGFLNQFLAQEGFIVFSLDNRGMGNRGRAFEKPIYRHMGRVEVQDQLAGVEYLKTLPYVDAERLGVFGWSYGGYMTLMCMARAPQVFRVGVSVAPVTDWKLYDTHYTERYMDHPANNAAGYEQSSVLTHAHRICGKLLLVHGMADDNVLFQNSVLLMETLQNAGVPFELMTYPGKKHGILGKATRKHLFEMIVAHFKKYLQ